MIKSDRWIEQMCREHQLLSPYLSEQLRSNDAGLPLISAGITSYGYDLRLAADSGLKVFSVDGGAREIDPKNFDDRMIRRQEEEMVEDIWIAVEDHANISN